MSLPYRDCPKKILDYMTGRAHEPPDAYDDLPAIVDWGRALYTDPWVPERNKADLLEYVTQATRLLTQLQVVGPTSW